ncbi:unnamed protein product [Thlaspi arvense]|uniref:Uncharacterized protein n=1 Tax=Thlaspi arvense TaxID=13288 RepID=A0AAU9RL13_THLAR|nr:unnamed protein product [Thlaspi arvense]
MGPTGIGVSPARRAVLRFSAACRRGLYSRVMEAHRCFFSDFLGFSIFDNFFMIGVKRWQTTMEKLDWFSGESLGEGEPEANEAREIAGNIIYHARYSPHFFPLKFGPEQALYATAKSLRDHLIQVSSVFSGSFSLKFHSMKMISREYEGDVDLGV